MSLLPRLADQFGADSPLVRAFTELAGALADGLAHGATYVRQPSLEPKRDPRPWPAAAAGPQVVLLTDGRCASACLDFADLLRAIPGVLHAGGTTSADTLYMEIRDTPLPSGLGGLAFAMKVYRNRPRGSNVPYAPSLAYAGDLSDTERVRTWLYANLPPASATR